MHHSWCKQIERVFEGTQGNFRVLPESGEHDRHLHFPSLKVIVPPLSQSFELSFSGRHESELPSPPFTLHARIIFYCEQSHPSQSTDLCTTMGNRQGALGELEDFVKHNPHSLRIRQIRERK
jgi:hypothetical protein